MIGLEEVIYTHMEVHIYQQKQERNLFINAYLNLIDIKELFIYLNQYKCLGFQEYFHFYHLEAKYQNMFNHQKLLRIIKEDNF